MEVADEQEERVCRVCRSGEEGGQLYRACRCSGSIGWIHEDCLKDWLSVSHGHRCELCKYQFRWQKVYAAEAPSKLPTLAIARHLLLLLLFCVRSVLRFLLVVLVWLGLLPFAVRGAWQGFFHLGRSWGNGWVSLVQEIDWSKVTARSILLHGPTAVKVKPTALAAQLRSARTSMDSMNAVSVTQMINGVHVHSSIRPPNGSLGSVYRDFYTIWGRSTVNAEYYRVSTTKLVGKLLRASLFQHDQTNTRALARQLYARHHRLIGYLAKECFAGQIIVCCVIVAFVTIFLLREWVIANQPVPGGDRGRNDVDNRLPARPVPAILPPALPARPVEPLEVPVIHGDTQSSEATSPAFGTPQLDTSTVPIPAQDSDTPVDTSEVNAAPSIEPALAALSESAQAFLERQGRMRSTAADVALTNELFGEAFPVAEANNAADSFAGEGVPLALPALDIRAEQAADNASQHSSDSDESTDDDFAGGGAGAARRAANIAPADLAAIDAAEVEEEMIFLEADLMGILEAIGLLGPVIALIQNAALITLLMITLLAAAVWAPLMLGKTFSATNAHRLLLLPVNLVRIATDPIAGYILRAVQLVGHPAQKAEPASTTPIKSLSRHISRLLGSTTLLHRLKIGEEYIQAMRAKLPAAVKQVQTYWTEMAKNDTNRDRVLCVLLGYIVVLGTAGICLRHTRNIQARNATRAFREAVKQQMYLAKAALFFMIEVVLFPTICGILLNVATLPLLPGATISTRIAYHVASPITAGFLTWLAGTNFMFLFAQAISVVRKCLRKGVLWFIRDPSDPETNPLREILETPAFNQAKKITRSLFVYGAIVLTCFGTFPWLSVLFDTGILPLRWDMTRPIASVPVDLLFLLFLSPKTLGALRSRRFLRTHLAKWCVVTAHQLRLSSFMLGVRRQDEEGSHLRKTWKDWLLCKKAPASQASFNTLDKRTTSDVTFQKDGGFARVVAYDSVRIVPKCMFVRVNEDGSPLDDRGAQAIANQLSKGPNPEASFTIVYIPPRFKTRIFLFIYLLWFTGSIALFVAFTVPLVLGRFLLDLVYSEPLHDAYSLIVGLHVVLVISKIFRLSDRFLRSTRRSRPSTVDSPINPSIPWTSTAGAVLLTINSCIILPLLLGLAFHVYVVCLFDQAGAGVPTVPLGMSWCYGILLMYLTYLLAMNLLPADRLSPLVTAVHTNGVRANIRGLNLAAMRIALRLAIALMLPAAVTSTHLQVTTLLMHALGKDHSGLAYVRARVHKASTLSIIATTVALMLARPAYALSRKWLTNVWEKEYVIERKLRNIDDPPTAEDVQSQA